MVTGYNQISDMFVFRRMLPCQFYDHFYNWSIKCSSASLLHDLPNNFESKMKSLFICISIFLPVVIYLLNRITFLDYVSITLQCTSVLRIPIVMCIKSN